MSSLRGYKQANTDEAGGDSSHRFAGLLRQKKIIVLVILLIAVGLAAIIATIAVLLSRKATIPDEAMPWWKKQSVYGVFVPSYLDGDDDRLGDIPGLTKKVSYIKELGFNVVWVSAVLRIYGPYPELSVLDFTDLNGNYGSFEDFQQLVSEVKSHDMKLIMDFEINHSSTRNPWFFNVLDKKPDFENFYVLRPGLNEGPPNNWLSVTNKTAWGYEDEAKAFYLRQRHPEVAELNYRNPRVLQKMKEVLKFWMDKGVDGFHFSSTEYLMEDPEFKDEKVPGVTHDRTKYRPESYTDVVKPLKDLANSEDKVVFITMDTMLKNKIVALESADLVFNTKIMETLTSSSSCLDFKNVLTDIHDTHGNAYWPTLVSGTWNFKRLKSRLGTLAEAFQIVQFMLPGTPVAYYGEEIGMEDVPLNFSSTLDPVAKDAGPEQYALFSNDPSRTPMQWNSQPHAGFTKASRSFLPAAGNYQEVNVDKQLSSSESTLNRVKDLNQLRQHLSPGWPEIKCDNDILWFKRTSNNRQFITVVNLGHRPSIDLDFEGKTGPFQVELTTTPALKKNTTVNGHIQLGRHHGVILSFLN